ncbi:MAG TPA: serine hydrolase [Nitriliruptorales bacterium]
MARTRHRFRLAVTAVTAAALITLGAPVAAQDGPVVGTPPVPNALAGWIGTYVEPEFWTSWATDAIADGHFNLPYPTDPVKPEVFLPSVPVAEGSNPSPLPVDHRDWSDFTYEDAGATMTIPSFLLTTRTDGVVLVHDGVVVGEWYRNGYSENVRHQPWSVTKTFVAALIGIAHDEGLIGSLQDPIDGYLPDLAGTAWDGVTIENLLQMESGVHWDEGTPVLVVNTQVEQWLQLALDVYTDGAAGQTRNEFLAALPRVYEQGSEFRYNSGNTQVLAWLLETVYGKHFNEVLSEKLWIPMGAAGDAAMISDRVGDVVASQGLYARSHDFARFGELLRNGGVTPEGRRVLPAGWVDAMATMTEVSGGQYGYQTWAADLAADDAFTASGFQGQKISVLPSDCLTAVRLSYALGADIRQGDDPLAPDAYGFTVVTYDEEWQRLLRAVADELGVCASGSGVDPVGQPGGDATPVTGGGAALLGVGVILAAAARRRRRGRARTA